MTTALIAINKPAKGEYISFDPRRNFGVSTAIGPLNGVFRDLGLSPAVGQVARSLSSSISDMLIRSVAAAGEIRNAVISTAAPGSAEKLFNALAAAKVMTSKVSMHLDDGWRRQLFRELDEILSPEAWDERDLPVGPHSFETYLRFHLFYKPEVTPNLGVSDTGNLLAGWNSGSNHLALEFYPGDRVRWVLVRGRDDDSDQESAAGVTPLTRLMDVLSPYSPDEWLKAHGGHVTS
jgi:hypothetical protein